MDVWFIGDDLKFWSAYPNHIARKTELLLHGCWMLGGWKSEFLYNVFDTSFSIKYPLGSAKKPEILKEREMTLRKSENWNLWASSIFFFNQVWLVTVVILDDASKIMAQINDWMHINMAANFGVLLRVCCCTGAGRLYKLLHCHIRICLTCMKITQMRNDSLYL